MAQPDQLGAPQLVLGYIVDNDDKTPIRVLGGRGGASNRGFKPALAPGERQGIAAAMGTALPAGQFEARPHHLPGIGGHHLAVVAAQHQLTGGGQQPRLRGMDININPGVIQFEHQIGQRAQGGFQTLTGGFQRPARVGHRGLALHPGVQGGNSPAQRRECPQIRGAQRGKPFRQAAADDPPQHARIAKRQIEAPGVCHRQSGLQLRARVPLQHQDITGLRAPAAVVRLVQNQRHSAAAQPGNALKQPCQRHLGGLRQRLGQQINNPARPGIPERPRLCQIRHSAAPFSAPDPGSLPQAR